MAAFGWQKDRFDYHNYLHVTKAVLPDVIDMSNNVPEVRDQGQVGSCTGFGIGGSITALFRQQGLNPEWLSPTWIYNGARYLEGTLTQDCGAEPIDCYDWLLKALKLIIETNPDNIGSVLREHHWPYDPTQLDMRVPTTQMEGNTDRLLNYAYYRCVDGVDGICSALSDGHFVSLGGPWFEKWMDTGDDGKLVLVSRMDNVSGGHETFLYGYDRTTGMLFGQNSWGEGWGNKGRYLMPFESLDVFKWYGGYDAQYITFGDITPPPPNPTPSVCPVGNGIARFASRVFNIGPTLLDRQGRFRIQYLNGLRK